MVIAGILAAGLGTSMHRGDLPKQFLMLGTKPILIHTLEQFLVNASIDRIVVVAPQDWLMYTRDLIRKYIPAHASIAVIVGGRNKNASIKKIVEFLESEGKVSDTDILLNHDAIRPFVTQRMIDENITAAKEYGVVNTAVPTVDTILSSADGTVIDAIPSREHMHFEQTPQTSTIGVLRAAFHAVDETAQAQETEATRLILNSGQKVYIVRGEYSNIKIVTSYDYQIACALVKGLNTNDTADF